MKCEQSLEHGIPPSVLVIEAWSDETTFYIWNDAQYTPNPATSAFRYADFTFPPDGKWPDPKGDDRLAARPGHAAGAVANSGAQDCWSEPHPQHEADRAYFEQQGFGVRRCGWQPPSKCARSGSAAAICGT